MIPSENEIKILAERSINWTMAGFGLITFENIQGLLFDLDATLVSEVYISRPSSI